MAKLTEEQRQQRAAKRALRVALDAEEDDRRRRERDALWKREGTRLSWSEYVAGEPCRGCGHPMRDGLGSWPPLMKMSDSEKREYEEADQRFREMHADCRAGRWSVGGSRIAHCCFCCPPPPLGPRQIENLTKVFTSLPPYEERKKYLDTWNLTLTCGHVASHVQHREHDSVSTRVVDCAGCGERRGVVNSERVGPAYSDKRTNQERAVADRERLAEELAAAEAKLRRQRKNLSATERRIAEIQESLGGRC